MSGQDGPAPVTISRVTRETADLVTFVAPDVFDADIDPARLDAYLGAELNALFVALDRNTVVGHVRGTILLQPDTPDQLYIDNLGVTESHRRRGIAHALMDAIFAWGRDQGCAHAWVGTESGPEYAAARALYQSLGEDGTPSLFYVYDL